MNLSFAWTNSRWWRLAAASIGLTIPVIWLGSLLIGQEDTVRLRSALLYEMGATEDFDFTPDRMPPSFLANATLPTPEFQQAAADILTPSASPRSDLDASLSIVRYLGAAPEHSDGPIQSDLLTSLTAIRAEGRGYCADYSKVFNGLALASTLPVRQWGFAFNAFGSGHTFNEVFDRARAKWILIDSFHSLYFVDKASGEPLSTLEVHDALLSLPNSRTALAIQRIDAARFPFRSDDLALDYYRRGMPQLYLVWGNNVFDYENSRTFRTTFRLSRSLETLISIALGHYPRMRVYPVGVSDRDVEELRLYRTRVMLAAGCMVLAMLVFLVQFAGIVRAKPPDDKPG